MLIALLAITTAQAADCESPFRTRDLQQAIDDAEFAWSDDRPKLTARVEVVEAALPCMVDELRPPVAGRVHRLYGLRAVRDGDEDEAAAFFAAARYADRDAYLPDTLVPDGDSVHELWTRIPIASGTFEDIEPAGRGKVLFDGQDRLQRPTRWPAIVQVVTAAGAASTTVYLKPGDPMPEYMTESQVAALEPKPEVKPEVDPDPVDPMDKPLPSDPLPPPKDKESLQPYFIGIGVASGMGALALYGTALSNKGKFNGELDGYNRADLEGLRSRTNGLVLGSAGLAAVSAGAFIGGRYVVTW